jgi:hypothetical protein
VRKEYLGILRELKVEEAGERIRILFKRGVMVAMRIEGSV